MVHATIVVNNLTGVYAGAFNVAETPVAVNIGNDAELTVSNYREIILAFHLNASTNADTVTITAGANPPAFRAGMGDLVYTLTGGAKELVIGPLETARYMQTDGKIYVHFAGSTVGGTVECYGLA